MSTVSVVIVTYNAREWVPQCLTALAAQRSAHSIETVVLDNKSTEFTIEELRSWVGDDAVVLGQPENIGFGRGCNEAVRHSTGHYVLLLNPDAIIEAGAIDAMVQLAESDPAIGIVGGRVTAPDGRLDRGSCWGVQTPWSLFCFATGLSTAFARSRVLNPEGLGGWERDTVRRVGIVTGCLLLIGRPLWDELGGFDEQFFMYGEDADLCVRADHLGQQSWITPAASAVHALGASSGTPLHKQQLLFRGKASLVRKNHEGLARWAQLMLLQAGVALRAAGEAVTKTNRASWRGLWMSRREWRLGW